MDRTTVHYFTGVLLSHWPTVICPTSAMDAGPSVPAVRIALPEGAQTRSGESSVTAVPKVGATGVEAMTGALHAPQP